MRTPFESAVAERASDRIAMARATLGGGSLDLLSVRGLTRRFPAHFHDTFALGVVDHGTHLLRTRRGEWLAVAGDVVALAPGEVHAVEPVTAGGYGYAMLYPVVGLLEPLVGILGFRSPAFADPDIARHLRAAHRRLRGEPGPRDGESLLIDAARLLVERHARKGSDATDLDDDTIAAVGRARAMIEDRFTERLSLDAIAVACDHSPMLMIRKFRQVTGMTPYAYMLQLRVNLAQRLLHEGQSVLDVARHCGFSDQSHLARSFKRVIGIPPGRYGAARTRAMGER